MARFKINRNSNKEEKQVLQVKLDTSLVEDVSLLSKWSGNEKSYVVAELLRYALGQETDFQEYKQTLAKEIGGGTVPATAESLKKDIASERRSPSQIPLAR